MRIVDLNQDAKLRRQAQMLYYNAFPKEERLPWWILRLNARRNGIDLTGWAEGERLCGFTASVTVDDMHFLLFFAISEDLRGQGYGSEILSQLRKMHKTVVLNVELLDPAAENIEQRKRRFAFYQRNGFQDTFCHVWEVGGKFRVLSTEAALDWNQYRKIFRKLTFGIWRVKLRKAEM